MRRVGDFLMEVVKMNITTEQLNAIRQRQCKYGEFRLLPIEIINDREYAIEHRSKTSDGYDRLDGIDLTSFDSIESEGLRSARFDKNEYPVESGMFVMAFWPDEGEEALLTRNGGDRGYRSWSVALSKSPKLQSDIMDELEQYVDAGGHIF